MIAFPRTTIPVPDAVAGLSAGQQPARVQAAVGHGAEAARLRAVCRDGQYTEARQRLEARIRVANKVLAARNPRLVNGWADLTNLNR
ncbi:hypothetical protein [Streptomyces sp. NPDC006335]|uniref:hypothetical protein n=1 Tax=Streptomyces sp. NPDC006335 TaxID=3156895 RepID=UPI0033A03CAA